MKLYQPAFLIPIFGWKPLPWCETKEIAEEALNMVNKHFNVLESKVVEITVMNKDQVIDYINNRIEISLDHWDYRGDNKIFTYGGQVYRHVCIWDDEPTNVEQEMRKILRDCKERPPVNEDEGLE